MPDKNGKPYATVDGTKVGDMLVADGGFDCIKKGAVLEVHEDERGLWVICDETAHYLDGQIDGNEYVGLYPAGEG